MDAVRAELAAVRVAREQLDERELGLIERARLAGQTWTAIAQVLGLSSRQAAQQRHQRLVSAMRSRRRRADLDYAAGLTQLRAALAELERWITVDRLWDGRFARAALVRATVSAALDAPPAGLFALAVHVTEDLAANTVELPAPARSALTSCQRIVDTRRKG
ncbi:hypothetical protein [Micromonospora sp. NBC_01813]|uniref:hypothetical protein n=1 Tax=Micromonospora sp. NBC_01813 TaxID=2975988 RepID=UPI002DDB37A2|nr:hypothetical protein [Micromonospora sp. NBC_01813]WSA12284.1 hypothetical protein OG958_16745 [Micromonospora sp. NBC_01813]